MNIQEELTKRGLPKVPTEGDWEDNRKAIQALIQKEEFGWMPAVSTQVSGVIEEENTDAVTGHAVYRKVNLTMAWADSSYTFPVYLMFPKTGAKAAFLHIAFPQKNPLISLPAEEMVDRGFGVAMVHYTDIASDDNDFTTGLAGSWYKGRERGPEEPGKIALWAWALTKIMDYLETIPEIPSDKIAVIGHSRLGKTALFTGLMDNRIALTISNNSGCAGAAVNHGKTGETVQRICEVFPFWFDANYAKYGGHEDEMPWDQHFMLAGIAPRRVYVASAEEDLWADPVSERIGAEAARQVYVELGLSPDHVGEHLREGGHALARYDWLKYMEYMEKWIV